MSEEGGVWSDFDIIYTKPIKNTVIPNAKIYGDGSNINTCFSYFNNNYGSFGFIMSSPKNAFFKSLKLNCPKFLDKSYYESLGIRMYKKLYNTPSDIVKKLPTVNILILPEPFFLPYHYSNIKSIFHTIDKTK